MGGLPVIYLLSAGLTSMIWVSLRSADRSLAYGASSAKAGRHHRLLYRWVFTA